MGNGFKIVYEIWAAYPCNNCFGASVTASKTYSNGTYTNTCKSKQNEITEGSLKEQKERKTKTQHWYIQQANNAKLLTRAIFDCKLSLLLPLLSTENCRYRWVCCNSSQPLVLHMLCRMHFTCLCTSLKLLKLYVYKSHMSKNAGWHHCCTLPLQKTGSNKHL